jgi:hypothetical protein
LRAEVLALVLDEHLVERAVLTGHGIPVLDGSRMRCL